MPADQPSYDVCHHTRVAKHLSVDPDECCSVYRCRRCLPLRPSRRFPFSNSLLTFLIIHFDEVLVTRPVQFNILLQFFATNVCTMFKFLYYGRWALNWSKYLYYIICPEVRKRWPGWNRFTTSSSAAAYWEHSVVSKWSDLPQWKSWQSLACFVNILHILYAAYYIHMYTAT